MDILNEALQRASNPVNPPPARPSALDLSSPTSALGPSLAGHRHNNSSFAPPNTAVEPNHAQWHPPSLQLDDTPISQRGQIWNMEGSSQHRPSQSFSKAEADFHQQAKAFDGMSRMHDRSEDPSPPGANIATVGEPSQSKMPAADDLFSDVDDNEMPEFEVYDQDDNMFEMSGLGQQAQYPTQQDPLTSLQTIRGISQTPSYPTLTDIRDLSDPASHPSPTESQLVAEGFEFHNELPEEVQINRFNDKAFRKALREVQADLPRKQQWYAWSKAKQMLNSEPESAATEQTEKSWGEPLQRQDYVQHQLEHEDDVSPTTHPAGEQIRETVWGPPAEPMSLNATIHERLDHGGAEDNAMGRKWVAQAPQVNTLTSQPPSSPASTGGFAIGQGDWHAGNEAQNQGDWASKSGIINQDRLSSHPLGKLISKVAEEHKVRRQSEDEGAPISNGKSQKKAEGDRLSAHPLGKLISKVAKEHRSRRQSEDDAASTSNGESQKNEGVFSIPTISESGKKLTEMQRLRSELSQTRDAVISKMDQVKAKLLARRDGSAHGLLSITSANRAANEGRSVHSTDHVAASDQTPGPVVCPGPPPHSSSANANANSPPLPPRPDISRSTSRLSSTSSLYMHNTTADLLRPHTNTILRRSPSPSQIPPAPVSQSPTRHSPSPWIEHPGINRPDTPRPVPNPNATSSHPSSPERDHSIRQSVEPETPYAERIRERESTPAYSNRSPSPSPVSHLGTSHTHANANHETGYGNDTEMTDAPSPAHSITPPVPGIPTQHQHLPQNSSPDHLSSPIIHGGNTFIAPTTPLPASSPLRQLHPPPIPPSSSSSSPLKPTKTRRKSIGGQTSKPKPSTQNPNAKSRNVTAVQGANVSKTNPRSVTRKVTQMAQKVKKEVKKEGSKVAEAVKKIEEGIRGADGSPPRRSGRIAAKKGR